MTDIFPAVQPETTRKAGGLPLCRDTAWDFAACRPLWSGGRPVIVEGAEAVRCWAWKALMTARCRYQVYSWDYGSDLESLIGRPYTPDIKEAEAIRYVREALLVNPYIVAVDQIQVTFAATIITITCRLHTIYGEVDLNV